MANFKVICKASGNDWQIVGRFFSRVVVTKSFFGLIKRSKTIIEPVKTDGPVKEEVCIVTDRFWSKDIQYYVLIGYPLRGYDSRYFIHLDEFTESQKEIAEKAETMAN